MDEIQLQGLMEKLSKYIVNLKLKALSINNAQKMGQP
tara:strand:- start:171 stop:281 length:111 start_codon:yes stop_codon:yes gene_type:complete